MAPDRTRRTRRRFLRGSLALAGLGLLPGCGLLPLRAQPPARAARIGWLALGLTDDPALVRLREAFRQGLREHGYEDGRNLAIDYRSAEGRREQLPELAAELVRLGPAARVPSGGRRRSGPPGTRQARSRSSSPSTAIRSRRGSSPAWLGPAGTSRG